MNYEDGSLKFFSESDTLFGNEDDETELDYALALSLDEFEAKSEKKSDAFLNKIDEDSDYAFALSLQEEKTKTEPKAFLSKVNEDSDYALAISLQRDISQDLKSKSSSPVSTAKKPLGIVDEQWEVLDPTPDIHALFLQFNTQFFYGKLDGVEVKWSPRMTLCAGVCSYEGRGGLCSVRLSLPLLKLRPRRDLVETLLHEMIHAYLFVTANNKDHDGHGPEFRKHMSRINKETGTTISVYHNFHNEVSLYQKHIWKCNGPCQKKRPYYGYVKRAVNRAPGPRDPWWAQHTSSCGGTFTKVSEPDDYQKKSKKATEKGSMKRKNATSTDNQLSNIKKFFKTPSSTITSKGASSFAKNQTKIGKGKENNTFVENKKPVNDLYNSSVSAFPISETNSDGAFAGQGFLLGSSSSSAPKTFLANIRREIASSSKVVSKPSFANLHGKLASSSSTQISSNNIRSLPKESCVLGAQTSPMYMNRNEGKPVHEEFQKTISHVTKKPSYAQSSIDKFITSPSRPVAKNNSKVATKGSHSNMSPKVKCPVCFELLSSSAINSHLDFCLLSRS